MSSNNCHAFLVTSCDKEGDYSAKVRVIGPCEEEDADQILYELCDTDNDIEWFDVEYLPNITVTDTRFAEGINNLRQDLKKLLEKQGLSKEEEEEEEEEEEDD